VGSIGSGRKKGSKNKKIVIKKGVEHKECNGVLCKGKLQPVCEFMNSHCKQCDRQKKPMIVRLIS
jgi:hypothetical protein